MMEASYACSEASYAQQSSAASSDSAFASTSRNEHAYFLHHLSTDVSQRLISGALCGDELVSLLLDHGLHPETGSSTEDMQLNILTHIFSGACFGTAIGPACRHTANHTIQRVTSGALPRAELVSLLELHGMSFDDCRPCDEMQLIFLSHIFSGACFFNRDVSGCHASHNSTESTLSQFIMDSLSSVLANEASWSTRQLSVLCNALGSSESSSSRKKSIDYLRLYSAAFSSDWSPALVVEDIQKSALPSLRACCTAHSLPFQQKDSPELLRSRIINHFCVDACHMLDQRSGIAVCKNNAALRDTLLMNLMTELLDRRVRVRPLKRILNALHLPFPADATFNDLRKIVRSEVSALRRGKRVSNRAHDRNAEHKARLLPPMNSVSERAEAWPKQVASEFKEKLLCDFLDDTSSSALSERVCAVCGESKVSSKMHVGSVGLEEFEASLLNRRDSYVPNPCPLSQYAGRFPILEAMSIDWNGVYLPDECNNEIRLSMCVECYRPLVKKKLPPCALANDLFLGQVPPELKDLTIVEEALIARRRAKAWIVHLQDSSEEDSGANQASTSTSPKQRAMKGHVITYPSKPEKVTAYLPSSPESISSLMCVVFVGSKAPTKEWLKTKAKPLAVRREKVREALIWLKRNNPLYRDIQFNHEVLDNLPLDDMLPVEVHVQQPNAANEAQGGRYDISVNASCECEGTCTCQPSDAVLQNLVITDLDNINVSSSQIKAAALKHLKSGKGFIEAQHDADAVNEYEDELLFPLLYPTLFPYGSGGFELKSRTHKLSMKRQAKHLFSLRDSRFREHYSFLFTVFNILQRREVSLAAKLRIKKRDFTSFASELKSVSESVIDNVLVKAILSKDTVKGNTEEEKLVLNLMRQTSLTSNRVFGSAAARTGMRNEIRGMIFGLGLPSFYITINPADVYNPLVKFLAGDEINLENMLENDIPKYWEQAHLVAKNPFAAAKFFDTYIRAFMKSMLGYNPSEMSSSEEGGILGKVKGYYGCVEAQGRGTLHCHMLIWLDGSLDAQEIKDQIMKDGGSEFIQRLLVFIDDTIATDIPNTSEADHDEAVNAPSASYSVPTKDHHPCALRTLDPRVHSIDSLERKEDLNKLVRKCQSHTHSGTCYKYWKGPPHPKECRFNLDKSHHQPNTTVDTNNGEINFRVLDGMVNNYNPTIIEGLRCNMDIKFIGSGVSAKAILYYISDYITKTPLTTHVAYGALQAAMKKMQIVPAHVREDPTNNARLFLIKCANTILSNQELSAPQVASYLMDYGDHYASHKYRPLYWKRFVNIPELLQEQTTSIDPASVSQLSDHDQQHGINRPGNSTDDEESFDDNDDEVIIECSPSSEDIVQLSTSVVEDYQHRGCDFTELCVWDFAAVTDKTKITSGTHKPNGEEESSDLEQDIELDFDDDESHLEENGEDEHLNGEQTRTKVTLLPSHPQFNTHRLRWRKHRHIPVPLGLGLPRRDRTETDEYYCKVMLVLFKPWRSLDDLMPVGCSTWRQSFDMFAQHAETRVLRIIDNIQRLHECKDSRDDDYASQKLRFRGSRSNGLSEELMRGGAESATGLFGDEVQESSNDLELLEMLQTADGYMSRTRLAESQSVAAALLAAETGGLLGMPSNFHSGMHECHNNCSALDDDGDMYCVEDDDLERLWHQEYQKRKEDYKDSLKTNENNTAANSDTIGAETSSNQVQVSVRTINDDSEQTSSGEINDRALTPEPHTLTEAAHELESEIADFISEYTLNEEQALAFRIIAKSSVIPNKEPLRIFISGPGGTGKSWVIDTLKAFFLKRGQERRLRLASFTGVAAKNIKGVTIHSALHLNDRGSKGKKNSGEGLNPSSRKELVAIWTGVDYCFIDEVSMVSCEMLANISRALQIAKQNDLPFGGVNMIFAGDFAQLPPVGGTSLYSNHEFNGVSDSSTVSGQKKIAGRLAWLSVTDCITFHQSQRQKGDSNQCFRDLLQRLRDGRCTVEDYELLQERLLSNQSDELDDGFLLDAPVITRQNAVKDALNMTLTERFSTREKRELHMYYARDLRGKKKIADEELKNYLWDKHTGQTNYVMGRLPLVIGMPVFLTTNYDVAGGVVNGSRGILKRVRYEIDPEDGRRYAKSCVIEVPDSTCDPMTSLVQKEVVALAEEVSFTVTHRFSKKQETFKRIQLPVVPAFAMTDYKAQGQTLQHAVLDLHTAKGIHSAYVMLSRAVSLDRVLILRHFEYQKIHQHMSEDLRREYRRIEKLCLQTVIRWSNSSTRIEEAETKMKILMHDEEEEGAVNQPCASRKRKSTHSKSANYARLLMDESDSETDDTRPVLASKRRRAR